MPADETTPLLAGADEPPTPEIIVEDGTVSKPAQADGATEDVENHSAHDIRDGTPDLRLAAILPPLMIGVFLAAMDNTIVVSSYGRIGSELNSLEKTSWIATAYLLTTTAFQPLYGKLSDIFGRKACLLFAYGMFSMGSLWCGLSRNMDELIVARAFAGIGGGGMTTVVSILMSDLVPLQKRGTMQGIINIVFATGASTGAPLGGFLADNIGWRWAFLIQTPAALVAAICVAFLLHVPPRTVDHPRSRFFRIDFLGALTLVLAVLSFLVAMDRGGNVSWRDIIVLVTLPTSALMFFLFGVVEHRFAQDPFAPLRIVGDPALLACYLTNFFATASFSILFYIPLYFQAVAQLTGSQSGLRLLPAIIGSVSGSLGGGILMQKTGKYYWLTIFAYVCMVCGQILIVLFTGIVTRSYIGIGVGLALSGFGGGIGITTTLIGVIAKAGSADQAVATAVSYLFRSLGSVMGVSISSTILQGVLRAELRDTLRNEMNPGDIEKLVKSVTGSLDFLDTLDPELRSIVVGCYEAAVHWPFVLALTLACSTVVCSTFIKEYSLKKPDKAADAQEVESPNGEDNAVDER